MVQHVQADRDGSIGEDPRKAMRARHLARTVSDPPVAIGVAVTLPLTTPVRLPDQPVFKSLFHVHTHIITACGCPTKCRFITTVKEGFTLFVLICLIVAAVLFALAAFGVVASRINLVAAGLFFWVLTAIIPKL